MIDWRMYVRSSLNWCGVCRRKSFRAVRALRAFAVVVVCVDHGAVGRQVAVFAGIVSDLVAVLAALVGDGALEGEQPFYGDIAFKCGGGIFDQDAGGDFDEDGLDA